MRIAAMLMHTSTVNARKLAGILFLLWAGAPVPVSGLSAPAPSSFESEQAALSSDEHFVRRSTPSVFNGMSPCNRLDESTWVPVPAWEPRDVLDLDEVFYEASVEGRLVILVVYAEGCRGWSRTVEPLVAAEGVSSIAMDAFYTYAVNADDDEQVVLIEGRTYSAPQVADMLAVETYPAFALFDGGGKLLQILQNPDSRHVLQSVLENTVVLNFGISESTQSESGNTSGGDVNVLLEHGAERNALHVLSLEDKVDGRPLAVFFEEPGCQHCDHFRYHILSDPRTRSLLERFRIARYELPSTSVVVTPANRQMTVAQWSREMGITRPPAVVIFDMSGRRIGQTGDHTDLFRFQSLLDYVVSDAYRWDPDFTHFLRHRARHLRSHGEDIDRHIH